MTTNRDELLECPFCGGRPEITGDTSTLIVCSNDQCAQRNIPFNDFSHRDDAIRAWNTRALPQRPEGAAVAPRNLFAPGDIVRHRKGGEYAVLFRADYEPTMTDCYVYRGEDGHTWARPALVMEDGRFTLVRRGQESPPASAVADDTLNAVLLKNGEYLLPEKEFAKCLPASAVAEPDCNWPDCGFDTNGSMPTAKCCKTQRAQAATVSDAWRSVLCPALFQPTLRQWLDEDSAKKAAEAVAVAVYDALAPSPAAPAPVIPESEKGR